MVALANWLESILGSARVSRAGESVSPSRTLIGHLQSKHINEPKEKLVVVHFQTVPLPKSSFRRNAETSTLQECGLQKIFAMAAYLLTGDATAE